MKYLHKDGAYTPVYDTGEQERLEKSGWVVIPGTPFEHKVAQQAARDEPQPKRGPGRPKKDAED